MIRRLQWLLGLGLLSLLVVGCGDQSYTPLTETLHYVGVVNPEKVYAYIGIAVKGNRFTAYICSLSGHEHWLHGTISSNGTFDLGDDPYPYFKARIRRNSVRGTYSPTSTWPPSFNAEVATGDAGVYRLEESVEGKQEISTWVLLNDGTVQGCIKTEDSTSYGSAPLLIDPAATWIEPDVDP